jgi:hypothetical protein
MDGMTKGPGDESFTRALCQSLEELREESKGGCFPVIKLQERINKKRKVQSALVWDRLQKYGRHIQLGELVEPQKREASFSRQDPEEASLVLRFSLKTTDLSDDRIRSLARKLPEICKEVEVPVRQIDWVRMERRDQEQTIRKVLSAFRRNIEVHRALERTQQPDLYLNQKIRLSPIQTPYGQHVKVPNPRHGSIRRMTNRTPPHPSEVATWQSTHQRPEARPDVQKLGQAFWRHKRFWFYLLKVPTTMGLLLAVPYSLKDRLKLALLAVCLSLVWRQNPGIAKKVDKCVERKAQKCSEISESIVEGLQRTSTF